MSDTIINVSGFLTDFTGGRSVIELHDSAETVGDALSQLWQLYPGLRDRVMTEQGQIRMHVNVFLEDENIRRKQLLATKLPEKSEITILPSVSGGNGHNNSDKTRGAMKATWNGVQIASSDDTIVVEGNHYFQRDAINKSYFRESGTHTTCPWKGEASYYDIVVDGEVNKDAAWYYPEPKPAADEIKDRIAFWRGVKVEQE